MKKTVKRKVAVGILVLMLSVFKTTAFASKSGDFYYSNGVDAYVHGYVDLQSNCLASYVWCNVSLQGRDRAAVSATYKLKTNKKTLKKSGSLSYSNLSDSYDAKKGGANAKWAKLIIKYDGKSVTLEQSK